MFAIIKTGGKQYKVAPNDIIKVEKLAGASGDRIEFTDILMMGKGDSINIGTPLIANAKVFGTVVDQKRDDKVIIFKKKRRHNYRRKNGHRQYVTFVQITDISPDGHAPKAKASPVKVEEQPSKENTVQIKDATEKPAQKKASKAEIPSEPKVKASAKKAAPKAPKSSEK